MRVNLRHLGFEPSDAELAECYRRVTALADQAKQVRARDLLNIANEVMRRRPRKGERVDSDWGCRVPLGVGGVR